MRSLSRIEVDRIARKVNTKLACAEGEENRKGNRYSVRARRKYYFSGLSGFSGTMDSTQGRRFTRKEIRKTRNGFILYLIGVLLQYSAFLATINLQSSINISNGLGTISLATIYITAAVFSILFTPTAIRKFGSKWCLYVSDIAHSMLILANFYPAFFTLIPGAILAGIGEGMIWISMPIMNIFYGRKYSALRKDNARGDDFYTTLFSGWFFTTLQLCQVFGNLVSYVVLYALNNSSSSFGVEHTENLTTIFPYTSIYQPSSTIQSNQPQEFYYCGANDCQDPGIVSNSRDQYVPADRVTVIMLMSILLAMSIVSIILHVVFLPDVSFPDNNQNKKHHASCSNPAYEPEMNIERSQPYIDIMERPNEEDASSFEQTHYASTYQETHLVSLMKKSVRDLGKHLAQLKQVLIIPITLYNGLSMGFAFSELTRSYSSCVLGVDQIGICMAIYGCADSLLSFVIGRFGQKLGRPFFFLLATSVDIGNYLYCILWNPNLETSWSIYLIFFTLGFTDGIWQTLINVMYIEFFPKHQEIAQTSWNFLIVMGFSVQFAWSSSLCMYIKIYIQFGVLALAILSYGGSELLHRKKERSKVEEDVSTETNRGTAQNGIAQTTEKYINTISYDVDDS